MAVLPFDMRLCFINKIKGADLETRLDVCNVTSCAP